MAMLAKSGDIKTRAIKPMTVLIKEKITQAQGLSLPVPCHGPPSKQVATEEGVPGMLRRMAAISPEIPPI